MIATQTNLSVFTRTSAYIDWIKINARWTFPYKNDSLKYSSFLSDQAHAFISKDKFQNAINKANEALRINPKNEDAKKQISDAAIAEIEFREKTGRRKGYEFLGKNDFANALKYFKLAYEASGNNSEKKSDYLANQANALKGLERFQEAIEMTNLALNFNPENSYAKNIRFLAEHDWKRKAKDLHEKGVEFLKNNQLDKALLYFDKMLNDTTNSEIKTHLLATQASSLIDCEEYKEAIERARQALIIDPNYSYAKSLKVIAEIRIGNPKRIKPDQKIEITNKKDLEKIKEDAKKKKEEEEQVENEKKASQLNSKGFEFLGKNELESALKSFSDATALTTKQDDKSFYLCNKVSVLIKLERFKEAIQFADQALVIKPDYDYAKNLKICAMYDLKQQEKETRAQELNDQGRTCLYRNETHKALGLFFEATFLTQKNNSKSNYLANQAEALIKLERYEEATKTAIQSMILNPINYRAVNLKILAEHGMQQHVRILQEQGIVFLKNKEFKRAIQLFDEALEKTPNNNDNKCYCLTSQASALIDCEQYEEAIKRVDRALKINPVYSYAKSVKILAGLRISQAKRNVIIG